MRQEFGLLVVRYLLRKNKHTEAATRARAVQEGLAADDPLAMRLKVYLAACDVAARKFDAVEKDLKAVLDSNADNDVKALARNTLGDYFRASGEGDKAFWEYIWVDVHYNQDREELSQGPLLPGEALRRRAQGFDPLQGMPGAPVRREAVRGAGISQEGGGGEGGGGELEDRFASSSPVQWQVKAQGPAASSNDHHTDQFCVSRDRQNAPILVAAASLGCKVNHINDLRT